MNNSLIENPYIVGISAILLNVASVYVFMDITPSQKKLIKSKLVRRITFFLIILTATKNVVTSLMLTAAFVILNMGLFHEESRFCIIPRSIIEDNTISYDEYKQAKQTVEDYEKNTQVEKPYDRIKRIYKERKNKMKQ